MSLVALALWTGIACASGDPPARCPAAAELRPVLDRFFGREFAAGHAGLDALARTYPGCAELSFYRAAGRWAELQRRPEDSPLRGQVAREIDAAVNDIEAIRGAERDPFHLLALGGAYGFRARLAQLDGRWFVAYRSGRKGRDVLRRVLSLDPDLHDAKLGLGMYDYMLARAPAAARAVLTVLAFSGNRERGLRELEEAATKGHLASGEAHLFLRIVYADLEHDPVRALPHADELASRFPGHAGYGIEAAFILVSADRAGEALERLRPIWDRSASAGRLTGDWTGDELFRAAEVLWAGGDRARARQALEASLVERQFEKPWRRSWAALRLGQWHDGAGSRDEALRSYAQTLTYPDRASAHATSKKYRAAPYASTAWPPERPPNR